MSRLRERTDTKLYYSISEASAIAKVKPHVLRYWETQFKMLRPKKNKAGNRMYRKRDLKLIQLIKELLYDKGYTISGARRKLLDDRAALRDQIEIKFTDVERLSLLNEIIRDLKDVLDDLKQPPGEVARRSRAEEVAATARDAVAGAGSGGNGGNGAGHTDTMTDSTADVSADSDDDSGQDTAPEPKILGA
ncbi:MAG: MerR family transcriptional regulator [Candidatus Eisenbacteria bacterium]|nr:MerR family transcriptional regulator [Candidatus Eisenbacteria bacterium]